MPVILPSETDLYALTDSELSLGRSVEEVAEALLGAGIRILQYREKNLKDGAKLEECRILRRVTEKYHACFMVDDHVDLAMICHADGVHVGQEDIPLADVRALVGTSMCIVELTISAWGLFLKHIPRPMSALPWGSGILSG